MAVYTDRSVAYNRNFNITHLWKKVLQITTPQTRRAFFATYIYNRVHLSLFGIISSKNMFVRCVGDGCESECKKKRACTCVYVCVTYNKIQIELL